MTNSAKIPVIVLTGFLGSGKTTLLNRLIADNPKTAVIINEFGATPIDQDLLQQNGMPLTTLAGGCLCCTIKGTLAPTLKNLWMAWDQAASKPFERIIIEASGVASPEPILDTLLRERWLASRYHLQTVITTLAIPSAIEQLDNFAEARAQVAWADVLLLTHEDLADEQQQMALAQSLKILAPATPKYMASHANLDTLKLISAENPVLRRLPNSPTLPTHSFRSLSLHFEQPLPWPQLEAILQKLLASHPSDLQRIKGVVYLSDQAEPQIIQAAANRLYRPVPLPSRAGDSHRGRLVFIGSGNIQTLADELQQAFGAKLAANAIRLH